MLINERVNPTDKLLADLERIPLGRMYQASFKALMRLQVYFTGRTHELILEYRDKAQSAILRHGGKDQVFDGSSGFALQSDLLRMWGDTWTDWQAEFQQVRREAGMIAFGVMAVFHDRMLVPQLNESRSMPSVGARHVVPLQESVVDGVFDPQLRILLDVSAEFLYGDSMNLSGRIWKIDRETREGINEVLMNGIQKGDSAWNIAQQLEQYLGAGADCPRWTSTRLYDRTKSEIASGNTTGLLSGNACDGNGVSYNALRLARTEIQKMHALATDRMMAQQPWVQEEQINLSAAHPETDICDDTVGGGRDGQGIYEVGEIQLPLHPNCLCYKTTMLMPEKEFTSKLHDWLNDEQAWPEMDAYASDLGVDLNTNLAPAAINLAVWMFSNDLQEWLK